MYKVNHYILWQQMFCWQMTSFLWLRHTNDLWSILKSRYWLRRCKTLPLKPISIQSSRPSEQKKKCSGTGTKMCLTIGAVPSTGWAHLAWSPVRSLQFVQYDKPVSYVSISSGQWYSARPTSVFLWACLRGLISTDCMRRGVEGEGRSTCITIRAHILPALP